MHKIIICLLTTILIGCGSVVDVSPSNEPAVPHINDALLSSCAIIHSDHTHATGVLLKSGYVITAAHVIDWNMDGVVSKKERKERIGVRFYLDSPQIFREAEVLAAGEWRSDRSNDIAILKVREIPPYISGVRLASVKEIKELLIGEDIFLIGRTSGKELHITTGVISPPARLNFMRVSATSYFGNSGGGVFLKKNGLLLGITAAIKSDIKMAHGQVRIPRFNKKGRLIGFIYGQARARYKLYLSDWTEFLSSIQIRRFASEYNISFILDDKKKD